MGLQTAKEVQELKHAKRQSVWPEMRHIKQLAHQTLAAPGVRSIEEFVAAFNKQGASSGFRAEAYHNNEGAFQGLRFYAGAEKFKASEIDRSLGKKQLERTLGLHTGQQRAASDRFSESLTWDLQQAMRQEQEEWEEWKPIVPKWRKVKRRGVSIKP